MVVQTEWGRQEGVSVKEGSKGTGAMLAAKAPATHGSVSVGLAVATQESGSGMVVARWVSG